MVSLLLCTQFMPHTTLLLILCGLHLKCSDSREKVKLTFIMATFVSLLLIGNSSIIFQLSLLSCSLQFLMATEKPLSFPVTGAVCLLLSVFINELHFMFCAPIFFKVPFHLSTGGAGFSSPVINQPE